MESRIATINISDDAIIAERTDGRSISVPLVWSWRLANATPVQRKDFEFIGSGQGIHRPDIDKDICAQGMLEGVPARPTTQSV